jgi:capsule polysaccharide export protein KpsE/RkpR
MPADSQLDRARRQRLRYAERKLKEARQRLARAERSILYWSRILADIRHERTRAIQPPLWPEEEPKADE